MTDVGLQVLMLMGRCHEAGVNPVAVEAGRLQIKALAREFASCARGEMANPLVMERELAAGGVTLYDLPVRPVPMIDWLSLTLPGSWPT